jgi:hypothetical protein
MDCTNALSRHHPVCRPPPLLVVTAISGLLAEADLQREILAKRALEQNRSDRKVPCTNTQCQCFCMANCKLDLQREILAKRAEEQNRSDRKVPCTNTQCQCFCRERF